MENEIIKRTIELFDNSEKWNSFLELACLKDRIMNEWNSKLKDEIINKKILGDAWTFDRNGMQWYLQEFGQRSLSIWLEGEYFSLWAHNDYFDINLINDKLKEPKYKSIYDSIKYKDIKFSDGYFFREKGRFEFNSIYDNHFDSNRLAWFAGNETDKFIKQLELKLQPFMSPAIIELIAELNRLSKK